MPKLGAVKLLGLRTIIYPAPDLAEMKRWWTALLGQDPYFDQPFYVGYSVGGGIRVAAVRTPQGSLLGLIFNPHLDAEPSGA